MFDDELRDLKSFFVHEYTHYLQVLAERNFNLDFNKNKEWLMIVDKIFNQNNVKENLFIKLKEMMIEELERNQFEIENKKSLSDEIEKLQNKDSNKDLSKIANNIISLCIKEQRTKEHKSYIYDNLKFIYDSNYTEINIQKLYLEKLNKDEGMQNYYDDPVELHARLNENLLKLKGRELIKDFDCLSKDDNESIKRLVIKDLKKFNNLITNHFELLKKNTIKLKVK